MESRRRESDVDCPLTTAAAPRGSFARAFRLARRAIVVAWPLVVGCSWSTLAVVAIAGAPLPEIAARGGVAVRAIAMVVVMLVLLGCPGAAPFSMSRASAPRQYLAAAALFAIGVLLLDGVPDARLGSSILIAAGCEEMAFRLILPAFLLARLRALGVRDRHAAIVACFAAQVVFAVAHGVVTPQSYARHIQLIAAGLLFSELLTGLGFWSAAAVHASINYLLILGVGASRPSAIIITGTLVIGLLLLVTRWAVLTVARAEAPAGQLVTTHSGGLIPGHHDCDMTGDCQGCRFGAG